MQFDEALKYLGDFGRYQKVIYFTLCLLAIPCAWHSLGNTFLSASPDHHCSLYDGYTYNTSQEALMSCAVPRKDDGSWDSCRRYNISIGPGGVECSPDEPRETIPCDMGWVFDSTFYDKTAVTEFNLVCENDAQRQLSKSLVLAGKMVGSMVCGQLADFAGRKKAFTLPLLIMVGVGTGASFVHTFTLFCVMQFLLGVSASGTFVVAIVIATEMVGKSQRATAGIVIEYFYSIGYMSMALIAWRLRDWHTIELAISIPPVIFLAYYFIVPESPRWLLSKGKTAEAEKIVRKAAKINKVKIPESVFQDEPLETKDEEQVKASVGRTYTFFDLLRYPNMRKKAILIYFIWLSNNLVYYGLSFFSEDLGNDPYFSFFLAGAVEVPAYIVCQLLLGRIGRKWLICIFMTIGGVSLLCAMAIPTDMATVTLVIAMIGKLCISGSYAIVYLYAIELFPTPVRNVGVGMGSFVSRIGSIASPYVLYLGDVTFFQFPFLVFGSFALLAGVSTLLLPDTLGAKLPQTMEEGEAFGKNMTFREMFKLPNCRRVPDHEDDENQEEKFHALEMSAAYCNVGVQTED
ncbi:organic cation transporter protein-like [Asterias amurensis]|uniref:organic cation transporter protein-like n=1 Tax=Asterias amurensis TaxID=7602 RepID=UPI003AB26BC6